MLTYLIQETPVLSALNAERGICSQNETSAGLDESIYQGSMVVSQAVNNFSVSSRHQQFDIEADRHASCA